jgi:hypothetical protein
LKLKYCKKLKLFFIFYILYLSIFLSNKSLSENNISCKIDENHKIKVINVKINKNKSWTQNNIKILISNTKIIPKKLKKRFSGEIIVNYEDNSLCKLKAKIRQNGDFKDHINYEENKVSQSLDVKLINGNIGNITNFKLLLDGTRGVSEDEIFLTEIFRTLNYISPRTRFVNVNINGSNQKMLFQEKIRKELLEYNRRTESGIFEANENDLFKSLEKFKNNNLDIYEMGLVESSKNASIGMFVRQTNSNWFKKSTIHSKISFNALSKLNLIYSNSISFLEDDQGNKFFNDKISNFNLGSLKKKNIINLEKYNLILKISNAEHALNAHNRIFYWNNSENYFEPIYYDGNPNIFKNKNAKINLPINIYYKSTINKLEKSLNNLDLQKFKKNFFDQHYDFSEKRIEKKIAILKYNLSKIKESLESLLKKKVVFEEAKKFEKETLEKTMKNKLDRNKNAIFVFKKFKEGYENDFLICKDYYSCDKIKLNNDEQANLVEGNLYKNSKEHIFISTYPYDKINQDIKKYNYFSSKDNKINFYYDNGIKFNFDKMNNTFLITQIVPESRAYFINSNLKNMNIIFTGIKFENDLKFFPIDSRGLTGCLVFYKSNFKNTNLKVHNSNCEDSLNLVGTKGEIDKIEIINSFSDGLDIDFSNLVIQNTFIENSKNDCVDVSGGTYTFKNIDVNSCGDKGLSVGEKTILKLDNMNVKNSKIGIASKDGSVSSINKIKIKNVDICFSAYNKKQEFSGGQIKINEHICSNFKKKTFIDNQSKITFNTY